MSTAAKPMFLNLYKAWTDREPRDPGLRVWTSALKAWQLVWPLHAVVLEIGCQDTDWLTLAHMYDPTITPAGLDWRPPRKGPGKRIQGDVLTVDFPPASVDVIVMLSTLEHIGLGHYYHDPLAEDGDTRTLQRCREWLKPMGWVYADVPYNPNGYHVHGTKHRIYDDAAIETRLQVPGLHGGPRMYANLAGDQIAKPVAGEPVPSAKNHVYVALTWQKRG